MATNGDAERLQQVERAIVGDIGQMRPANVTSPNVPTDDIMGLAEAQAAQAEVLAKYILEHGQFQHDACVAYAKKMRAEAADLSLTLHSSEERKMAELRKSMGKLAR